MVVVSCVLGLSPDALGQTQLRLPDGLDARDWAGIQAAHRSGRRAAGVSGVPGKTASASLGVSTVTQQAYIKASNAEFSDIFGQAVALSGDTVVVTAPFEDSDATGVNGSQGNEPLFFAESGAAYVLVRDGSTWTQQAYLKASNTGFFDRFGESVAISGDTIVVGAQQEESQATGINGNQANNSLALAGAAYVFVRNGTTWSQQAYIKASNTEANDQFGHAVAISGDTLVVGANLEDSNATGVNSNQNNNSAPGAGAAYVFQRTGTTWSQQAYLKPSNTGSGDLFGVTVSISGETIVVGASGEDSRAKGVNGAENDNSAPGSGAAYVFTRSGSIWSQQAYVKASNTGGGDSFGISSALSGDTLVLGADMEDSSAAGINGDQASNTANGAGAAYVFTRSGTTWSQQAYLKASNTDFGDRFGAALALSESGDQLAVSAWDESGGDSGVNGDASDNSVFQSGAAYLFKRFGTTWVQRAYLKAFDTGVFDSFGRSVALSDDMLVAAATGDDSGSVGMGGDPFDNSTPNTGSLVVFDMIPDTWTNLGGASVGSAGGPALVGTGDLLGGDPVSLELANAPAGAALLLWISFAPTSFAAVGGTVHAFPFASQIGFVADGTGALSVGATWPLGVLPETQIWFQFLVDDPSSQYGITLSNGLHALTP